MQRIPMESLAWNRGKAKITGCYGGNAFYVYYCVHKCGHIRKKDRIRQQVYGDILFEYFTAMAHEIARYGTIMQLPNRLGKIYFTMYKKKIRLTEDGELDKRNLAPDWKETKQLWMEDPKMKEQKKLIYHLNEDTDGYVFKVKWNKPKTSKCKNSKFYSFKANRILSSAPRKFIKQGITLNYRNEY